MPDITMCLNKACPLRHKCYRFTAKPNADYQSYSTFTFDRFNANNGGVDEVIYDCEHFVDNALYSTNQINLQHG